jgi:NADH:ubiquinone oxidoreductase subunit C
MKRRKNWSVEERREHARSKKSAVGSSERKRTQRQASTRKNEEAAGLCIAYTYTYTYTYKYTYTYTYTYTYKYTYTSRASKRAANGQVDVCVRKAAEEKKLGITSNGEAWEDRGEGRRRRRVERGELEKTRKKCSEHTRRQLKVRTDRTAVDRPQKEKRFRVVYNRRSRKYAVRRRVEVEVSERERRPTMTGRYKGANWRERERWDMYGVGIEGHTDRRRLLTDYGMEGYPRRKDYPLSGYKEVRYNEARKRVGMDPVERSQEMRF